VNREMTDIQQESRAAHPIARTVGNVTGAVAGTLPAMAAAPEMFGIGLASKPLTYAASIGSGAVINGADAAVRSGGNGRETIKGGLIGGGLGLAAPIVAPLIGKGVKAVADKIQLGAIAKALGLDKSAAKVLASAVRQDAVEPGALSQLGDNGMLMDLGPNLRHTAGAIAATPGEGKAIVRGAIGARDANANWRIRSSLNETLGEAPTPSRIIDRATRNQANRQPEYREALREASPVDSAPIARYLDAEAQTLRGEAQKGVQRVRNMLNYAPTPDEIARARASGQAPPEPGLISDAGTLLNARHAVDDLLETTQGSNALNALQTARQAIDDELRATVPGIKEVDAKYAELARQKDAVQRGQTVLSSGREAPRPDELAEEVRQGALPQGLQVGPSAVPLRLREGARAEIERIVGTNANDRVALQRLIKGEGDWNRARLSTLFGQDKAKAIIDLLDREKLFADTSNIVTRNSETAARIAARDAIDGSSSGGFGVREGFIAGGARGAARAAGTRAVESIIDALRNGGNDKAIADMARSLTGGPQQSAVLDALMRAGQGSRLQQSQIDRVARALLLSGPTGISRP
ncbi:MAG: ester cyclase, partial [Mesorhizobium sp.]